MRIGRREFVAGMAGLLAPAALALPTRPRLTVLLVIEQFRPDYLDSVVLPAGGGFRKVLDKAAYFPDCRNAASTFPASSIATLATGAWPAQHGIVADYWYDRSIRNAVKASDDALTATTLAAQVIAAPRTRVTVLALNPAHAALFAGTTDAKLYWMDEAGQFVTGSETPDWLAGFNAGHNPDALRDTKWVAFGAKSDAPPLRTLSYSAAHPSEFMMLYKSSHYAQTAQMELACQLIDHDHMGQGNTQDFLCILAGSTELLGYDTGAGSALMQQMTLQLDRPLDALLAQLVKTVGDRNFSLVIAGAHGAPPEPAPEVRERMSVNGETIAQTVERHLAATGSGRVEKYLYPYLYLDTSGFRDPEPIRQLAARAAMEHPAVAGYFTAGGACSTHDEWEHRYRNSFHATRSGDLILSYQAEYVEEYAPGRGVSYGSLYNYDVRVPLCFYGPQFKPGVYENPIESVDVAATLARVMGVAAPSSSVGRVLGEALAE